MNILLSSVAILISGITMFLSGVFSAPPEKINLEPYAKKSDIASVQNDIFKLQDTVTKQSQKLGATNAVPSVVALFETSLASAISSSAASMTLTSATDITGTALASSTYGFIIDEGTASQELVLADCTGTACTNITRGISVITGTTTVAALQKSHRRGASVKITDGPQLMILSRIINGIGTFPNKLAYTSTPTLSNALDIVYKGYADAIANQGAATSTESVGGISELATALEQASSTYLGVDRPLVLNTRYATDTPQYGCAVGYTGTAGAGCSVIASLSGKIKQAWINLTETYSWTGLHTFSSGILSTASSTFTAPVAFAASTTFSGVATTTFTGGLSGIYDYQAFTSDGTWTKPAKISGSELVFVQAWGPGGGGGSASCSGGDCGGGGGGGGAYVEGWFNISQLSGTVSVTIGTAPTAAATSTADTSFGTQVIAYRGAGSASGSGTIYKSAGAGGGYTSAANGSVVGGPTSNSSHGGGASGDTAAPGGESIYGGGGGGNGSSSNVGGASIFGGGGGAGGKGSSSGGVGMRYANNGGASCGTNGCTATAGTAPGGGGGGCGVTTGQSCTGGAGSRGEVRVWVYR